MGVRPRVDVEVPDVDEYSDGAWCSRCNRELNAVRTPHIPIELLVDDELVLALQDADVDAIPAFGWECNRHRTDVRLPAPYVIAPDTYEPVEAELGDTIVEIAVPAPILEEHQP